MDFLTVLQVLVSIPLTIVLAFAFWRKSANLAVKLVVYGLVIGLWALACFSFFIDYRSIEVGAASVLESQRTSYLWRAYGNALKTFILPVVFSYLSLYGVMVRPSE